LNIEAPFYSICSLANKRLYILTLSPQIRTLNVEATPTSLPLCSRKFILKKQKALARLREECEQKENMNYL
jgi:hypothetical protein